MAVSYLYPTQNHSKYNFPAGSYANVDPPHSSTNPESDGWINGTSSVHQWFKFYHGALPGAAGIISSYKDHSRLYHASTDASASKTAFLFPYNANTSATGGADYPAGRSTQWSEGQVNTKPGNSTGWTTYTSAGTNINPWTSGVVTPQQINGAGMWWYRGGAFTVDRRCSWLHWDVTWETKAGLLMTFGWGWVLPVMIGAGSLIGGQLSAEPVEKLQPLFKQTLMKQYWQGYRSQAHDDTEVSTPGSISFPHTEQEVKMLAKNLDSLKHRVTVP
jgi:hypothetical protein